MNQHPQMNVLYVAPKSDSILGSLLAYLKEIPHVEHILSERPPSESS